MTATVPEVETEKLSQVEPSALWNFLYGNPLADSTDARRRTRDAMVGRDMGYVYGISRDEYRDQVFDWLKKIGESGMGGLGFPSAYGGEDDPAGAIASFETLAHGDLSLLVKVGVQFGLTGGAIHRLGTERHHETYLPKTPGSSWPVVLR